MIETEHQEMDREERSSEELVRSIATSPVSYWIPEYIEESAWFGHAPFAGWLMSVQKPRTVVELGTHLGFSYFAFCEFASRLGLSTSLTAIDTWQGDEHAGFYGEEVFAAVSEWNARFANDSTLVRATFDDARSAFAERSIDLLHIDGRHRYEDVVHDFNLYQDALSDTAVVLFHDTAEVTGDFGVHRFWDELRSRYPTFSFTHSHGLGVALVGSHQPEQLRALAAADDTTGDSVRTAFLNHGLRISRLWELGEQAAHVTRLTEDVANLTEQVDRLAGELSARKDEIAALRVSTSWRITAPVRQVGKLLKPRHRHAS